MMAFHREGRCRSAVNQYKKKIAINEGGLYFLKDEFFDQILDKNLMQNKDTGRRPHYIVPSEKINGEPAYWAIPLTSKVEKYEQLREKRLKDGEKNNDFHITSLTNGMTSVLLLFNMFPVTENYIACDYRTEKGLPIGIRRNSDRQAIKDKFKIIRRLVLKGKVFYKKQPNANAIMRKLRILQVCSLELKKEDLVFLDGVTRIPYPDTSINLFDQICLIEQGYFLNRNDNTYGPRRLLPVHLETAIELKDKGYRILYLKDGVEVPEDCWPFMPNVFYDDIFLVRAADILEIYRKSHISRRRRLADKRQQKRQSARYRYRKEYCHAS